MRDEVVAKRGYRFEMWKSLLADPLNVIPIPVKLFRVVSPEAALMFTWLFKMWVETETSEVTMRHTDWYKMTWCSWGGGSDVDQLAKQLHDAGLIIFQTLEKPFVGIYRYSLTSTGYRVMAGLVEGDDSRAE